MITYDGEEVYKLIYNNKNPSYPIDYFSQSYSAKLVIIPECGHASHIENSKEFNRIVMNFIERF